MKSEKLRVKNLSLFLSPCREQIEKPPPGVKVVLPKKIRDVVPGTEWIEELIPSEPDECDVVESLDDRTDFEIRFTHGQFGYCGRKKKGHRSLYLGYVLSLDYPKNPFEVRG